MDVETFDQIALNEDMIGDSLKFVRENDMVKMISHNGDIFAVEPPMFAELEVTECEPGEKGNTATGATKPCTVETGAVVYVPLFVNLGDKLKIDTRTGEYLSRVSFLFISKYLYEVSGLCNKLKAGGNHTLIFAFFTGGNYEKKEKVGCW